MPEVFGQGGPIIVSADELPASTYHAHPGLSSSAIKEMAKSPRHFWGKHLDPDRKKREPSPAMLLGTAIHTLVLEPQHADTVVKLPPYACGRTKAAIEARERFMEELPPEAVLLSPEDFDRAHGAAEAVRGNDDAMTWLTAGKAEESWFAPCPQHHQELGLIRRGRVDYQTTHPESEGRPVLVDLKSSSDVTPDKFGKHFAELGYHIQAAWNIDGYSLCGVEVGSHLAGDYVVVAVETQAPFVVAVYEVPPEVIEQGRREYRRLLEAWADCRRSGKWPGPEMQLIKFPRWRMEA